MRVLGPAVFGSVGSAFGLLAVFWINAVVMGGAGALAYPHKKNPANPGAGLQ